MEFSYSREISEAIENGVPVVALESTVIAHGLPYPLNLETADKLEKAVRKSGAVPATIAVFKGIPTIGLEQSQLEYIATSDEITKLSIRDLPIAAARKVDGATTVASTMQFASMAGIKVFATGGIGGVHRGGVHDVSADLPVLASIPMVVVCAGAKIVLDLEATREWLETHGVCVLGWQTDEFPAFYSRTSGLAIDERVETADDVCMITESRDELGLSSTILVTAPVPHEFEIKSEELNGFLQPALDQAEKESIGGKALTPFLLSKMSEGSEGKTTATNIALLLNNTRIAADIAVRLNDRRGVE